MSSTDSVPAPTVSGVTVSSSTGSTVTAYPAVEDFSHPTSGWRKVSTDPDYLRREVEQSPDTVDHCCFISYRSITSARTLALEVLTIQFAQFLSGICVKVGKFAGRGLLQFARVARPLTIEQRHFMIPPRAPDALDYLIAEGRLRMQVARAEYLAMAASHVGMSDED